MNTAVRTLTTDVIPYDNIRLILSSKRFWGIGILLTLIFMSALAVVYVGAMNRILFSELSNLQKTRDGLRVEWEQLLVEQNTWSTPARVQEFSEQKLGMVAPVQDNIQIVEK